MSLLPAVEIAAWFVGWIVMLVKYDQMAAYCLE